MTLRKNHALRLACCQSMIFQSIHLLYSSLLISSFLLSSLTCAEPWDFNGLSAFRHHHLDIIILLCSFIMPDRRTDRQTMLYFPLKQWSSIQAFANNKDSLPLGEHCAKISDHRLNPGDVCLWSVLVRI